MTVSELVEHLQQFDGDQRVIVMVEDDDKNIEGLSSETLLSEFDSDFNQHVVNIKIY